jgi:hypothetical protein
MASAPRGEEKRLRREEEKRFQPSGDGMVTHSSS